MSRIVDASVAVKWLLDEDGTDRAYGLLAEALLAPDMIFPEVFNAVRKRVRAGTAASETLDRSIPFLRTAIVRVVRSSDLLDRAASLASRHSHPIYDCLYVALALAEARELVTADQRQLAVARNAGATASRL